MVSSPSVLVPLTSKLPSSVAGLAPGMEAAAMLRSSPLAGEVASRSDDGGGAAAPPPTTNLSPSGAPHRSVTAARTLSGNASKNARYFTIDNVSRNDVSKLSIQSPAILATQGIQFEADL